VNPTVSATQVNESCNGGADGSATLAVQEVQVGIPIVVTALLMYRLLLLQLYQQQIHHILFYVKIAKAA
jgi:hypothetical protein